MWPHLPHSIRKLTVAVSLVAKAPLVGALLRCSLFQFLRPCIWPSLYIHVLRQVAGLLLPCWQKCLGTRVYGCTDQCFDAKGGESGLVPVVVNETQRTRHVSRSTDIPLSCCQERGQSICRPMSSDLISALGVPLRRSFCFFLITHARTHGCKHAPC